MGNATFVNVTRWSHESPQVAAQLVIDSTLTYGRVMELVFKALADGQRRLLLDRLLDRDGQTVGELAAALPAMTRFGVRKHLNVLETANLVTVRRVGRRKLHYLNAAPIQLVMGDWFRKYARAEPENQEPLEPKNL
jgi:DNA-binding transcriptional ArsR family regulator